MTRPTPLEHYLYANNEIFKIVDSKSEFLLNGHKAAAESFNVKKKGKNNNAVVHKGGKSVFIYFYFYLFKIISLF